MIVNEFGKVGVDGELLQKMGACLDEITNGSIFCSCRLDQFEQSLMDALKNNPDVILVETSGLSDPTNIKKSFRIQKDWKKFAIWEPFAWWMLFVFPKYMRQRGW